MVGYVAQARIAFVASAPFMNKPWLKSLCRVNQKISFIVNNIIIYRLNK